MGKIPFSFLLRSVVGLWPSSTFKIVLEKFDPFLAVVDLIGEGRVDLAVGFPFFLPCLSGSPMADKSWIADDPQKTISTFTMDGEAEIPFRTIGADADWVVDLPRTSDRVCSHFLHNSFTMYEVEFKDVGFHLPFSAFQHEVLRWTKLSPSQIHPNSYAFMRAFELVCQHLEDNPSKNVFFALFTI